MKTILMCTCLIIMRLNCNAQGHSKYFYLNGFTFSNLCLTTSANAEAVLACSSNSTTNTKNLCIIKLDSVYHNIIWQKFYKINSQSFVPAKIITHSDGSYIVELIDTVGFNKIQLWKVMPTGTVQWIKQFYANLYSLKKNPLVSLPNGSIYFVHPSSDSLCVKKISSGGNLISETRYSGLSTSAINPSSVCYNDSSLYIGGYDNNSYNTFLLKTDTLGNIKWSKIISNTLNAALNVVSVLTGGIMFSTVGGFGTKVGRFNKYGLPLWQKEFVNDTFNIAASGDKNKLYLFNDKNYSTSIVGLDTVGNLAYSKSTSSYYMNLKRQFEARGLAHRGFNISSTTNTDKILFTRITSQGAACNGAASPTVALTNTTFSTSALALSTTSASILFTNVTYTVQTTGPFQTFICAPAGVNNIQLVYNISVYPNPAKETLTIESNDTYFRKFSIFDALGHLILSETILKPEAKIIINVSNFEPGIYCLQTESANGDLFNKNIVIFK